MRAEVSFEQSLEHCLQELAATNDVEASLRRYPQYAEQLRPLLEMAQATQRYYKNVPEAPGQLAAGRERLLTMAAQRRAQGVPPATSKAGRLSTRKMKLIFAIQRVAALIVVVLGIMALGGGIVWAADDSLPGDLLYPLKLAIEDTRLALASSPRDQVNLTLQFVEERTSETKALVAAGRPVSTEAVGRMERHVEQALTQTARATDEEIFGLLTQVAERTRAQERILKQIQATAPQQDRTRLERAVMVCRNGALAAMEGLNDVRAFRWRYQHLEETPEPTNGPQRVTITPQGGQKQGQEEDQKQTRTPEQAPVGTPHATPQGPQTTSEPQATSPGPRATSEPQATSPGPKATSEPQATSPGPRVTSEPQATSPGPQATSEPQATSPGPQATSEPQATSPGPQATSEPQATSPGPQATSEPQATSPGPQATSEPQATSPGPQATSEPQATSLGPQATSKPQSTSPGSQPGPGNSTATPRP